MINMTLDDKADKKRNRSHVYFVEQKDRDWEKLIQTDKSHINEP